LKVIQPTSLNVSQADNRIGTRQALGLEDDYAFSIDQVLGRAAKAKPNFTALMWDGGEVSFAILDQAVDARAAQLVRWYEKTLNRNILQQRIGVYADKSLGTLLLIFAALRAGAIVVPINPALKAKQIAHFVSDCKISAGFAPAYLIDTLDDATHWVATDVSENGLPDYSDIPEWAALYDLVVKRFDAPTPQDTAFLFYTSGSTGYPKGVMMSHHSCVLGAVSVAHYLGLTPEDRVLALLPLSFDYGFNQVLSAWQARACVALHDFFLPQDAIAAIARFRVTGLAAVPPLWHLLLDRVWPEAATSSLRYVCNSGGAITAHLLDRMRSKFPSVDIYAMYGLTEAFRSTYLQPDRLAQKPTSVGKAIPFAQVFVIDAEEKSATTGDVGEVIHTGPLVAQGYWNDEAGTARRFRPVPDALKSVVPSRYHARCVFTGDLGFYDSDGDLHVVGRGDDMLKVRGHRLSPQEVEDPAVSVAGVSQAIAFGLPDARNGARICLLLEVDAPNAAEVTKTVQAALSAALPSYAVPTVILHHPQFSRTAHSKIDRQAMIRWAQGQVAPTV